MQTEVELIAARLEGDRLRYLVTRHSCTAGTDPDATARAATVRIFPAVPLRRLIVHSTSWRYELGNLLLTYLAYSDELPFSELPLVLPRDARSVGAGIASVAAHAVRHLAFLAGQEPRSTDARGQSELSPPGASLGCRGTSTGSERPSERAGAGARQTRAGRPW